MSSYYSSNTSQGGGGGPYGGGGGSSYGGYGQSQNSSSAVKSNNNDDWFTDQTTTAAAPSMYGQTTTGLRTSQQPTQPPKMGGGSSYTPYGAAPQQGVVGGPPPQQQQQGASFYGQQQQQQQQQRQTTANTQNAAYMPGGMINSGSSNGFNQGGGGSGPSSGNLSTTTSTEDLASSLSGAIGGGGGANNSTRMKGAIPGAPMSGNGPMNFNNTGYSDIDFENEPPLLDELGINIGQIVKKTKAVILPVGHTSSIDIHLMDDDDLAGPLGYAMMLGGELLLSGKISFDVIYGFGLFGCLAMTLIINLMTPKVDAVSVWRVTSILGYCLIPVNILAALNCILFLKYRGPFGLFLAAGAILWCTVASTRLFERSCDMRNQRYLIAYPIMLLYTSFVIITIF